MRACQDICKRKQAALEIFEYIKCFYNRLRLYADMGYMSPDEYKENSWPKPLVA
jgi:putative transposase